MELLEKSVPVSKAKPINVKKEVGRYLRKWPWFLLSMALFYTTAKIYLRYAQPQYLTKATLKLQESKNKNTALSDLKNLGMGVSGDAELQGETTVIVSKPILTQVAENLNLMVNFYSMGKIKEVELYDEAQISGKIISLKSPSKFLGATYTLSPVGKNSYELSGINGKFPFGKPVVVPFGIIQIDAKPGFALTYPVKAVFRPVKSVVSRLENSVNVTLPPDKGLLMELSTVGPVPKKSEDILNEITKQYNIDGVKDKNLEAQNTQDFINDRLTIITDDLLGIESEKENFKRANQLTDLEAQAQMSLANANENTKQILTYSTQLDLVNSIYAASSGDQLLPTNMGLPASVDKLISEYNEQLLVRNRVLKQATNVNPAVVQMNKDLASLKNLIRKNLVESRETLNLQIGQLNAQLNADRSKISKYPTQEKIFRGIERQQTLKEQLYLYLLQKREENAITLAVTAPKAKVVNPAYTVGQVKPNVGQITYGALAAGFLLPLLFFIGTNVLDTKVHNKEHIVSHVNNASVIAEIPVNSEENAIVHPNDFSVFAESFRILTSNLKFLLKGKGNSSKGVILVTSSIKGEGKTTVAMNTALTLAGKNKVAIIGADIRNPQLHRFVDGKNVGVTDYLVSDEETPEKYIIRSGISENLDVLFSGAIAPNPNDLLDMQKFDDMILWFRNHYDYVVIDTAPVMLVSDTLHILENTDTILYVVKSDYTEKEMLDFAEDFKTTNKIKNLSFVLNSVKPENTRYGKKYGYGYYAYGRDRENKNWWNKII